MRYWGTGPVGITPSASNFVPTLPLPTETTRFGRTGLTDLLGDENWQPGFTPEPNLAQPTAKLLWRPRP
jgi:hypothetical protein